MPQLWIVTVKIAPLPHHDPHNKVTRPCAIAPICTDQTGAHHSFPVLARSAEEARREAIVYMNFQHITRVEGPFSL